MFIYDITITRVDENTPLSTPKAFTEYVTAKRDEDGNIIEEDNSIDISSIIDTSLRVPSNKSFANGCFNYLYLIIGGAIVIVLAALAFVIAKKRKNKKV